MCSYCAASHSYSGLVSFWVSREMSGKKKSSKCLEKGVECKDEIEKLATFASAWNFQNSECQCSTMLRYLAMNISYLTLSPFIFLRP
eukprot:scaffold8428_cov151-Skeletonema_menzelii.AAC.5